MSMGLAGKTAKQLPLFDRIVSIQPENTPDNHLEIFI